MTSDRLACDYLQRAHVRRRALDALLEAGVYRVGESFGDRLTPEWQQALTRSSFKQAYRSGPSAGAGLEEAAVPLARKG